MDSIDKMLSMLLRGAVETLDIPPHLQQEAVERYEEVSEWLAEYGDVGGHIYPQGSFRLGTVVRPNTGTGEFDIDLVFTLFLRKSSTSQAALKSRVGDLLHDYLAWKEQQGHSDAPKACEPRRRCWTLTYPGFHLDVLPTIPNEERLPNGILLTDTHLRAWQPSNPIGYATWFLNRSATLRRHAAELARSKSITVDDVPLFTIRTTLQRVVQVLKWHCMTYFGQDIENRPPSILLTTLAALAYDGEDDLFKATYEAVCRMPAFIERRGDVDWVPNPADEEENFADKWAEYPERRQAFYAWLRDITEVMDEVAAMRGRGLDVIAGTLRRGFSPDPITQAVKALGDRMRYQRQSGALRMTGTGLLTSGATTGPRVREHTFYGDHIDPSR
jgi:hypothetical protein